MNKKEVLDIKYKEFALRQTFLSAAIVDLSNWIKSMDTKISILMTIQGLLVTATLSKFDDLYNITSHLNLVNSYWKTIFLTVISLWMVSIIGVYVCGMLTLWPRQIPVKYDSRWFFDTSSNDLALKAYMCRFDKSISNELINDMSAELFKLNCINKKKSTQSKRALIFFSFGLGFHTIILTVCYLYGIWGLNCG